MRKAGRMKAASIAKRVKNIFRRKRYVVLFNAGSADEEMVEMTEEEIYVNLLTKGRYMSRRMLREKTGPGVYTKERVSDKNSEEEISEREMDRLGQIVFDTLILPYVFVEEESK